VQPGPFLWECPVLSTSLRPVHRTGSARPIPPGFRPVRTASLLAIGAALLLAACGGPGGGASSTVTSGTTGGSSAGTTSPVATPSVPTSPVSTVIAVHQFPVTVHASNGTVTLSGAPHRIVSLSPSLTEILYAVGAGGQVVAVDSNSNYPAGVPTTKLSGFQPNVEAIAGYHPDLVVASNDTNGLVSGLKALSVPILLLPAANTLADSYQQETTLGAATGHAAAAQQVVSTTQRRIAAAIASVGTEAKGLSVYHELDNTYYSVTSSTFIGGLYRMFGLANIADSAAKAASGYPQLSAEYVVRSAPGLIVLADGKCCGQSAATVAKRPAFSGVPAVTSGRVVVIDDDIASRWGPRIADFAEAIAAVLKRG